MMKTGIVKYSSISSLDLRIDPSLHLSQGIVVRKEMQKSPLGLTTIGDVTEDVFIGNIFSRNWVADKEHGITYLAASDSVISDLEVGKFISKKQASSLAYLKVKPNWTLITCSGTLGKTAFVNKHYCDKILTHDLLRIVPNDAKVKSGVIYAFLSSKYGYYQITQSKFGGVVKHINSDQAKQIIIPEFTSDLQIRVNDLIQDCSSMREQATDMLQESQALLKKYTGLDDLTIDDYNYFGQHSHSREVSCFTRNIRDIGIVSINAFNHSERVRERIISKLNMIPHILMREAIDENGFYSSGGVEVKELSEGHGIMLINQSDIFDIVVKGKWVVKKEKYKKDLLSKGEILIAKIGTLGEGESFCRCIFVGDELKGKLVSSAFYRMKSSDKVTPGYLYTWLTSDFGFRLLRHTQYGTKLCYPNTDVFSDFPLPIIDMDKMKEIDNLVNQAHELRYKAILKEKKAISLIEQEIGKWNN